MTLLHFFNCAGVAFGPSVVLYKALGMSVFSLESDKGGVKSVALGVIGYFLSQLVKLIIAGFLFNSYDVNSNIFSWSQEIAATILSAVDIAGVWYFLSKAGGATQDVKIFSFGLGWASAAIVGQFGPGLWMDARGLQFSWEHLQNAFHANVSLVLLIAFVFLIASVTASAKKGESAPMQPVANAAILLVILADSASKYLRVNYGVDEWVLIGFRAVWAALMALTARQVYTAASAPQSTK